MVRILEGSLEEAGLEWGWKKPFGWAKQKGGCMHSDQGCQLQRTGLRLGSNLESATY